MEIAPTLGTLVARPRPSASAIGATLPAAEVPAAQGTTNGAGDAVLLTPRELATYSRASLVSTDPTRKPLDPTGLDDALDEFRSFQNRDYYNEETDGAARQSYYAGIDWSAKGDELFAQLSLRVIGSHAQSLEYRPSRYVYPWVDLHPDGQLRSIYSHLVMSAEKAIVEDWEVGQARRQAENGVVFMQAAFSPEGAAAAFATQEVAALNCEHVVPQSWFGKTQPARGDLHHLFACDASCNSRRGNLPYDEFKKADDGWRDQCGAIGPERTFEPAGGKGPAARATLYFLLRYPGVVDRYDQADIERMLDWHRRYPPDLYEKHRNAAIEELQGNRNPLIDFPTLGNGIDFTRGLKGA